MCMLTRLYAALLEASHTRISSRRRPLVEMTSARASGSRTALEYRFIRRLTPPASPPRGASGRAPPAVRRKQGPSRRGAPRRAASARASPQKPAARHQPSIARRWHLQGITAISLLKARNKIGYGIGPFGVHAANRMRSCHNAWVLLARAAGRTLLQSGMAVPDRAGRAGQPALLSSKLSCPPAVGQRSARRPASRRPTPAGADAAWPSSHRTPVAITPSLAYAA